MIDLSSLKTIEKDERMKIIIAICVVVASIGVKYVIDDFKEHLDINMNTRLMKSLVVFSLIFINTKNLIISIFFTVIYNVIHYIVVGEPNEAEKKSN
jgi:hypothetical protein